MVTPPFVYRYARTSAPSALAAAGAAGRWLSAAEQRRLERIGDAGRRRAWLLGRLLAKRCVLAHVGYHRAAGPALQAAQVEIDSGDPRRRGKPPQVLIDGGRQPWSLSIAHTQYAVLVALAKTPGICVGVDLVAPASYGPGFRKLWLTGTERSWLESRAQPHEVARVWALKEAIFKACNRGERFRPARIEVMRQHDGRYTGTYRGQDLPSASGICFRQFDRHVAALVAVPDAATARSGDQR